MEIMPYEEAVKLLPDAERVHTFRGGNGILIGADWDKADILDAMKKHLCGPTGPVAQRMGHGLCLEDERGMLFIETRKATPIDKSERLRASRQGASPSPASRSAGSQFAPLHG